MSRLPWGAMPNRSGTESAAVRVAFALLFALAAAQYGWNAVEVTPLSGFDGGGHAGYILTVLRDARLPHPHEGWSTFHPPLYYIVTAAVWGALEPLGGPVLLLGLRAVSMLSIFAAVLVLRSMLRARGVPRLVEFVALAVALFVPVLQMAGTWLGNEAFGVALSSLALPLVLRLQRDPAQPGVAAAAGLLAGLALGSKYTGVFVAVACAVPFLRAGLSRRALAAALAGAAAAAVIVLPVYGRNLVLTGSPVPMTREGGFIREVEASFEVRPRRLTDYLGIPIESMRRPSIFHIPGSPRPGEQWNEAMQNVWGAAYASTWYDAMAHRVPIAFHRDGIAWGPWLLLSGLVPTGLALLGLALAMRETWRSRARSPDAPLVAMTLAGVGLFVAFTWRADAIVAAKASYLLPLLVPAGLFFAAGAAALPTLPRRAALGISLAAATLAAVVFTSHLVFPPIDRGRTRLSWLATGQRLPGTHIAEAVQKLLPRTGGARPGRFR